VDPVVACCFGRIVASDAAKESWFAQKENLKTKLQSSGVSGCETRQPQIGQNCKIDSYSSRFSSQDFFVYSMAYRTDENWFYSKFPFYAAVNISKNRERTLIGKPQSFRGNGKLDK